MKFRYTIDELLVEGNPKYMSDKKLLLAIITERESTLTNIYSPLSERLKKLRKNVELGKVDLS